MKQFNKIEDISTYTKRMTKGIIDKLFFVDKIDANVLVDFGCADGSLLNHLSSWFDGFDKLIGYDNDPNMIQKACELNNSEPDKVLKRFASDWEEVKTELEFQKFKNSDSKNGLILNSLIHEIYHYSRPEEIDEFWDLVFKSNFDYIVIRDMMPARSIDRPSNPTDISRIYSRYINSSHFKDFENVWGSIESNKNLIHFLLKYRYFEPNWDREVNENYLPLFREDFLSMIPINYSITYEEHYCLPFIRREVKKDLGIIIKDPTHIKIILEKED